MLSRQPVSVAGWPRRHARGRSDASTGSTGAGNPAVWAGGGRLARAGIVPCGISRLRGHQFAGRPAGVGVRVPRRRRADIPGLHGGRAAGPGPAQRPHGAAAGRCFGNPHSEDPTSAAASTALIERTRRSVLDYFSASPPRPRSGSARRMWPGAGGSRRGRRIATWRPSACLAAPSAPRSAWPRPSRTSRGSSPSWRPPTATPRGPQMINALVRSCMRSPVS